MSFSNSGGNRSLKSGTPPITQYFPVNDRKSTSGTSSNQEDRKSYSHEGDSYSSGASNASYGEDLNDNACSTLSYDGNESVNIDEECHQLGDDKEQFPLIIDGSYTLSGKSHCYLFNTREFQRSKRFIPYPPNLNKRYAKFDVKMPYSYYLNCDTKAKDKLATNLWDLIEKSLRSCQIRDSYELQEAILSYNEQYRDYWSFDGLHAYFQAIGPSESYDFFYQTLPKMIDLALRLPKLITKSIPLLRQGYRGSVTMSQEQAACILANAFFCTFPERSGSFTKGSHDFGYPAFNFNSLFEIKSNRVLQKLQCLVHYFGRVTKTMPRGIITYERRQVYDIDKAIESSRSQFCKICVDSSGLIEDATGMSQIDFANKRIGGGVLRSGCVQEEILFLISPELIVSLLITQVLDDNECLIIRGSERFSHYSGYSNSFRWTGNYVDKTPRDSEGKLYSEVVAIDALVFSSFRAQLKQASLRREFMKAYCGFNLPRSYSGPKYAIATGNWGCGAFGGDKLLKGLIQMMAAAEAGRPVCYYTFGDKELMEKIVKLNRFLRNNRITVGLMWQGLLRYAQSASQPSSNDLLAFIHKSGYAGRKQDESIDSETL